MKQSIRYLHATAGFPVESKWIKSIKAGNYVTWPELTAEAVHKHFPESDETQKGHMKQQHQNVRSTKIKQNATDNQEEENHQIKPQAKLKDVYIKRFTWPMTQCISIKPGISLQRQAEETNK